MGLSASMWTSVSGLLAHGNKMNVVGNNIANVSTIGFKSQRMDFNDYLYLNGGSTSGPTQIGAGVSTYAVIGDFSQGSLESTNSVTDIAIDGNGFFKVRKPNSDDMYYTRAGDFYFNADRQLQNPEGYRLQGWKIDNSTRLTFKNDSVNLGENPARESAFQGTGTPQDIILDSWYLEPQRTSSVNFTMGLTADNKSDRSTSTTSPLTALFDQWDATKKPPMPDSSYATSSSIKVYDEGGNPHTLSVYYDQVATEAKDANGNTIYSVDGLPAGYTMYEYVVTIPPEEDLRSYGGTGFNEATNEFEGDPPTRFYNDPVKGTNKNAGMLMSGHLIFDAAGNLVNQTAYTYAANDDPGDMNQSKLEPDKLSSWQATKFSSNGLPVFCANFTGQPLANSVSERLSSTESQAQDFLIELDFGLRTSGEWVYTGSMEDLRGTEVDPTKNTPTRVSPASRDKPTSVTFKPGTAGSATAAATSPSWTVNGTDVAASSKQEIYFVSGTAPDTKRTQIAVDQYGPKVISETDNTGQTPNTKYYLQGMDGEPLTIDGKKVEVAVDTNGRYVALATGGVTGTFEMDVPTKYIPQNVLNGEYQTLVTTPGTGGAPDTTTLTPLDLRTQKDKIYAVDDDGKKIGVVQYNPDGEITGILPEGATTPIAYTNQRLFFDQASKSISIDYNKDFSTYDTPIRTENATTAGNKSFITQDAGQNGYASGILSSTNITNDGVVYGYYDNGQTIPLYQIALYDFHNHQGLRREGGNLYAQTKESGEARQGVAGEAGFGVTRAYNIEMSNVDLSREFVNMITTQRGFQANSKGITTVDTMLETVIGMKR